MGSNFQEEVSRNSSYKVSENSNQTSGEYGKGRENDLSSLGQQNYLNLGATLEEMKNMENLNELQDVFSKLHSEMQQKSDSRKTLEERNAEMEMSLKSSKYFTTELQKLQSEEAKTGDDLRGMIETKRVELEQLYSQQVNDLEKFENDVYQISLQFINGPKVHESNSLVEKVFQLKKDLEERMHEFSQYKEDLQVAEGKLKQSQKSDEKTLETPVKMFEESIEDINTLNDKLTKSVEQITNRVNSMRFEMGCFSLQK